MCVGGGGAGEEWSCAGDGWVEVLGCVDLRVWDAGSVWGEIEPSRLPHLGMCLFSSPLTISMTNQHR